MRLCKRCEVSGLSVMCDWASKVSDFSFFPRFRAVSNVAQRMTESDGARRSLPDGQSKGGGVQGDKTLSMEAFFRSKVPLSTTFTNVY